MKRITIALLTTLVILASDTKSRVWGVMRTWPVWWKLLAAVAAGLFAAFAVFHALDLWDDFLHI